jgi:hypothetical protein
VTMVEIKWFDYRIDLRDNLTETKKKLASKEAISSIDDERGIYIISVIGPFAISYPKGPSDIVYIGSGKIWNRINQAHSKKWMLSLESRIGLKFQIRFASPRVKKSPDVYKYVEGDLIREFIDKYGSYPLINRQKALDSPYYSYSDAGLDPIKRPLSDIHVAYLSIAIGLALNPNDLPDLT